MAQDHPSSGPAATLAGLAEKGLTFDHPQDEDQLHRIDDHDVAMLVATGVVGIDSRPIQAGEGAKVSLAPESVTGPLTVDLEQSGRGGVALSRQHLSLPARPPRLPEEITHLWLVGTPGIDRSLAWYPEHGWFDTQRQLLKA